jgi:CheY-like chemotaxis protein
VTTILHVEDDSTLAIAVREAFEAFGFRGSYLVAATVADARSVLGGLPRSLDPDLIVCDMHLPDGTGLDVVRYVRSDPLRRHVPIVILSANVDGSTVDSAYVLGANSYVDKATRGRSMSEIVKSLYTHWVVDVRLPSRGATTRTLRYAARAMSIRARFADAYVQIAETLGLPDGEIWIDLALREGNIANLLAFLTSQLGQRELPPDVLDAGEAAQQIQAEQVATLEQRRVRTRDQADRYMRVLISNFRADVIARVIAYLFPVVPVAMSAMRELGATRLEHIADWIETHSCDPELRGQVMRLRADAARIKA